MSKKINYNLIHDNFIIQLNNDIQNKINIYTDSKSFIIDRMLELYDYKNRGYKENDLPVESLLGSIFLIKNNNILEFYSWCDFNHSCYLQINKTKPVWLGTPILINYECGDPENIIYLLSGNRVFYEGDTWQYFISQFVESGFKIYLKKHILNNIN